MTLGKGGFDLDQQVRAADIGGNVQCAGWHADSLQRLPYLRQLQRMPDIDAVMPARAAASP